MSEIKQIADAYGLSYHSVKKWSKAKRDESIRNLQAGVNPIIAELVGELQREVYIARFRSKRLVNFDMFAECFDLFDGDKFIVTCAPLNPYELQGAIVKVKELHK